jgi:hypothetical protein
MARLNPDNPDNTRTTDTLSGDIPTRTDRTSVFRHVRLSGVRSLTSSFPRSVDIQLSRSPTWSIAPRDALKRGVLGKSVPLSVACRAIITLVSDLGKRMGLWARPCIDVRPAKPRPLAQPKALLFPWFAPVFSNRWGWGKNLALARSSTCPLPTRRRAGKVVPGGGRNSDCAQNDAPRLSRGSASRCASCPPVHGSRRADSPAAFWRAP